MGMNRWLPGAAPARSASFNGLVFSCRLPALANAADLRADTASETQKSRDLARRKAVSWNTMLDGGLATRSEMLQRIGSQYQRSCAA